MHMKRALAVLAISVSSFSSYGAPIIASSGGEYNGHYYEVYSFTNAWQLDWNGAKSFAESLNYSGSQGHLVTLTSKGEDDFVWGLNGAASAFLGASDKSTYSNGIWTHNEWQWVTGEDFGSYQNFFSGEPNNWNDNYTGYDLAKTTLDNEDYLMYWSKASLENNGRWNDTNLDSAYVNDSGVLSYTTSGFIVEYEPAAAPASVASVPVPPTAWLFVSGLAFFIKGKKGNRSLA